MCPLLTIASCSLPHSEGIKNCMEDGCGFWTYANGEGWGCGFAMIAPVLGEMLRLKQSGY